MAKSVGLREQVKKGALSASEALEKVVSSTQPSQDMVGWLRRRIARGLDKVEPPKPKEEPKPVQKVDNSAKGGKAFPSKSVERRFQHVQAAKAAKAAQAQK